MESYIQVIDAQLNNESQDIARISFVEMPNEKLVELYERINNKACSEQIITSDFQNNQIYSYCL